MVTTRGQTEQNALDSLISTLVEQVQNADAANLDHTDAFNAFVKLDSTMRNAVTQTDDRLREDLRRRFSENNITVDGSQVANERSSSSDIMRQILAKPIPTDTKTPSDLLKKDTDVTALFNYNENGTVQEKLQFISKIPFFCYPRPQQAAQSQNKGKSSKASTASVTPITMNLTAMNKACLENYIHFDVEFDHWDLGEGVQDINFAGITKLKRDRESLESYIMKLINDSYHFTNEKLNEETIQISNLLNRWDSGILDWFGYSAKTSPGSNHDFQILQGDETILVGETKNSNTFSIPHDVLAAGKSHAYCTFGFGSKIAGTSFQTQTYMKKADNLKTHLYMNNNNAASDNAKEDPQSDTVRAMLSPNRSDIRTELESCRNFIFDNKKPAKQHADHAIYLFGATMQACIYSIKNRFRRSIVMTGRMIWFLRFDQECNKCTIKVSDGFMIGRSDTNLRLLHFLKECCPSNANAPLDENAWKEALFLCDDEKKPAAKKADGGGKGGVRGRKRYASGTGQNKSNKQKRCNAGTSRSTKTQKEQLASSILNSQKETAIDSMQKEAKSSFTTPQKRNQKPVVVSDGSPSKSPSPSSHVHNSTKHDTSCSTSARKICVNNRMTNEEQMAWQKALSEYNGASAIAHDGKKVEYLGIDNDGIVIPYLYQLESVIKDLGYGRCGVVKKISWNGDTAAIKEYQLQHYEDVRDPIDVYKHELEVLRSLKPLWGNYVPRLLFHNPWPSCPCIGMEDGVPMLDDFDDWKKEHLDKLPETLERIRDLGFTQRDMRGKNFVLLRKNNLRDKESIAVIDFESMKRI